MRLGVYGGTFDPIHSGHLAVASRLHVRFQFDRLLFVPASVPPHKRGLTITHECHRFAMIALAIRENRRWALSTVELDCAGPHYSIDTVTRLHELMPEAAPLYFIMGADSFEDLPTWHEYLRLIESCHIIVTTRPGHGLDATHLPEAQRERIVDLRGTPSDTPAPRPDPSHTSIYLTADAHLDISSTMVRERARRGEELDAFVPDSVADYITKQELYTDNR